MMKKILTKPAIIGGIFGIVAHIFVSHQGNIQSLLIGGNHIINGIAFFLAGAFLGEKFIK